MTKVGVSVDKESLDTFFKTLDGKTVTGAIADGAKKHIAMPAGGEAAAKEEEKPAEKEDEPEDVDMGGLFGDDD